MALLPAGLMENVYASLDRYLTEQLVTAGGLTLRGHAERRFIPPVDDPWVEAHYDYLGLWGEYRHRITSTDLGARVYGVDRNGYLQLNIYRRARTFATRYLLGRPRDVVVSAFPEGGQIALYDYAHAVVGPSGSIEPELVGAIIVDYVQEHTQDTGYRTACMQHIVQVYMHWLEHFTRG